MVSKDSITLGLSSASIAATESQFSSSSWSSSRLLSLIVPSASTSSPVARSPAGLNGVAVAGAVAGAGICGGLPGWPGTAIPTINCMDGSYVEAHLLELLDEVIERVLELGEYQQPLVAISEEPFVFEQ